MTAAQSDFVIEELAPLGAAGTATTSKKGAYEIFRWNAAHKSIPVKPFTFGLHQRTVRTDYPGGNEPTEQILGPNFVPFTLSGYWDDRYNMTQATRTALVGLGRNGDQIYDSIGGFARKTWKRFEAMVQRGNPVRITFESVVIEGIITDAEFDYQHEARIGYSFTLSPHHRQPGGFFRVSRSPRQALSATQLLNDLERELDEMLAIQERAPTTAMVGTIYLDAEADLDALVAGQAAIAATIEQRQLSPELEPNASLLRLSAQFYSQATLAVELISLLYATDSSEALNYEAASNVLLYDYWSRGLMYYARRMVLAGQRAAADIAQRADPNAIALYQPQAGQSLYDISNRFYGTAHQWRKIAHRNGLSSLILDGTETLVIPEVTTR